MPEPTLCPIWCHACGAVGRTWPARRVLRSGRKRTATVQTRFCRKCAENLIGLRLPPVKFAPLNQHEIAALKKEASKPNWGGQYFTANDVLRLIATIEALTPIVPSEAMTAKQLGLFNTGA